MRSSFQTKRLKLQSKFKQSNPKDKSQQKQQIHSMKDSLQYLKNQSQTSQSLKKSLQDLQHLFNKQKLHSQQLNNNIDRIHIKNIQRQVQYKNIIQRMIPFCIKQKSTKILNADLKQVHNSIISLFDQSNRQHQHQLLLQTNMIHDIMQKKIEQIKEYAYKQVEQNKKYLKLNYQKIERQISQILALSVNIYTENYQLKEQVKRLEFNNSVLKEEKELLINQVLDKKNLIHRIYAQLQKKYDKDSQLDQYIKRLKLERKTVDREFTKFQMMKKSEVSGRGLDKEEYKKRRDFLFSGIQNSQIRPSNEKLETQAHNMSKKKNRRTQKTIQTIFSANKQPMNKVYSKTLNLKHQNLSKTLQNRRLISQQSLNNSQRPSNSKVTNTIEHLEQTLKRQKKKTQSLKRQLIYLRQYQAELQKIIKQLLANDKNTKYGDNMRTIIKQLSNRILNNSKNPTVNSGFEDINMLLENQDQIEIKFQ